MEVSNTITVKRQAIHITRLPLIASANTISFPDSSLNKGNTADASTTASTNERRQSRADSTINWRMIWALLPPVILRTLTSLARLSEPAILILMKLIAAICKMKAAIPRNNQEKTGLLSLTIPASLLPSNLRTGLRWMSLIFCKP